MTRTATVRTEVADPELVAACVQPDNTTEMTTEVADGSAVVTRIEREDTAGLQSTVDDYVVNLTVAAEVAETARTAAAVADRHTTHQS
ncbi:KEOPS complex subunit Pcc1 [Halobacterium rubrum]|uniref:KEOPS complex subunit Pcc1 n=1 Tax=Halobacterium TaxID=2239 RepID=UPI001F19263E|nr:KEOPS complex subunit Pcc1 [Halobacterium rubrum]MDH5020999.1 KEOPS complex subunit Pcc1 [Halobacterium rubrum]